MAAVEVTISGVLYDKLSRTTRPVVLIGEASLTGLGVGGGPIDPGSPPGIWGPTDPRPGYGLPGQPPGIWGGGNEGFPTHPIAPGGRPPGIWGPTDPRPTPPIQLPPEGGPPNGGAPPPEGTKPPPAGEAGWGYYDGRWGYFPGPQDAQPKAG